MGRMKKTVSPLRDTFRRFMGHPAHSSEEKNQSDNTGKVSDLLNTCELDNAKHATPEVQTSEIDNTLKQSAPELDETEVIEVPVVKTEDLNNPPALPKKVSGKPASIEKLFIGTTGTCTGYSHLIDKDKSLAIGFQDAGYLEYCKKANCWIAVVADGCSSCRNARIGADALANWAKQIIGNELASSTPPSAEELAKSLTMQLTDKMAAFASLLVSEDWTHDAELLRKSCIDSNLMATLVIAVITPDWTAFFAAGDGTWGFNGKVYPLPDPPGNAPAYLAYRLMDENDLINFPHCINPEVHLLDQFDTESIDSVLIATDGFDYFENDQDNPDVVEKLFNGEFTTAQLRSYLRNRNSTEKVLSDDVAIVFLRRDPESRLMKPAEILPPEVNVAESRVQSFFEVWKHRLMRKLFRNRGGDENSQEVNDQ